MALGLHEAVNHCLSSPTLQLSRVLCVSVGYLESPQPALVAACLSAVSELGRTGPLPVVTGPADQRSPPSRHYVITTLLQTATSKQLPSKVRQTASSCHQRYGQWQTAALGGLASRVSRDTDQMTSQYQPSCSFEHSLADRLILHT